MSVVDMKKSTSGTSGTVTRGMYFVFTLLVIAVGWAIAAANTGISYLAVGTDWIPITTGVIGCFVFAVPVTLLHNARWLALASFLPAIGVLVGSVQYAPEAALDARGVRTSVRITADSAEADGSNNHRFTLVGPEGRLDEPLTYSGDNPGREVGERLDVITDPEGVVPMEAASDVDPGGQLGTLAVGVAGWTGIALLAGRRGFVRRRAGHRVTLEDLA
ncbi:hypothetical protein ACFWPU_22835 [Streptomyces sp. NPDC058471]|uniref:hypothetical protein n=1 Tax=Streptomyces sp. NPDC058471 TaxID=3346516 RepID=UPI003667B8CB